MQNYNRGDRVSLMGTVKETYGDGRIMVALDGGGEAITAAPPPPDTKDSISAPDAGRDAPVLAEPPVAVRAEAPKPKNKKSK